MKKCMIENSQTKIYVCEHTKLDRVGFAKLAAFDDIDYFVSEKPLDAHWEKRLEESDTKLILA